MEIANPTMWWGLLGLAIPIIIHLLSKRERHVVALGSVQFLEASESESARSLSLSQIGLLLLRLLLLGLICLLLAQPFLSEDKETTTYWIEESIQEDESYTSISDGLPEEAEVRVFSIGTATSGGTNEDISEGTNKVSDDGGRSFLSLWTLIDHLNQESDSTVVYTHSLHKDFIGPKVAMSNVVNWNIIPIKDTESTTHTISNDRYQLEWKVQSEDRELFVTTSELESSDARENQGSQPSQPLQLQLVSVDDESKERFEKLINLTKDFLVYEIEIVTDDVAASDIIIVLGESEDALSSEGADYSVHWDASLGPLKVNRPNLSTLNISGDINRESILDSNLPVVLASFLNTTYTGLYDYDLRVFDPTSEQVLIESDKTQKEVTASIARRPLHIELLILLALLIIGERWYAHKLSNPS